MSVAERLAEDIELNPRRYRNDNPDDIINNGTIKVSALISRANQKEACANLARVQASRPLRPPSGPLSERRVRPGEIEAHKVRAREVKIEINRGVFNSWDL